MQYAGAGPSCLGELMAKPSWILWASCWHGHYGKLNDLNLWWNMLSKADSANPPNSRLPNYFAVVGRELRSSVRLLLLLLQQKNIRGWWATALFYPTPCLWSHLKIDHGRRIYTMEMGRQYESGVLHFWVFYFLISEGQKWNICQHMFLPSWSLQPGGRSWAWNKYVN